MISLAHELDNYEYVSSLSRHISLSFELGLACAFTISRNGTSLAQSMGE